MPRISTGYYAAAAGVAIAALIAGPLAWSALRGSPNCGTSIEGADIAGPFTLVSETGETVTDADVVTGPTLVYFGYTFCPDICPVDNLRNAEAVDLLAERGISVKPVFVSVDPGRDTPEVMAAYTEYIHPEMLGLTGTDAQVAEAADAYAVYYEAHEDQGEQYLVDHTTYTYLVDPKGPIDLFRRDATPEEVAERIACHLS